MMKRFIIGAMLILGLCSWVKAQKIDVRIRVVDEWNRPLQGVMMRIGGNDDESFLSDKDGMIECRADKGAELNFEKYNQLQRKLKVTGEVMRARRRRRPCCGWSWTRTTVSSNWDMTSV